MCAEHQIDITRYLPKYDVKQTEPSSDAEILERIAALAGQLTNPQWRTALTSVTAVCQAAMPQLRAADDAKASAGGLFAVAPPSPQQQAVAPSPPAPNPPGKS